MNPKVETRSEAKSLIESIFAGRARNDLNSVSLANALAKDIATGFAGGMNYIYELLQNADDSSEAPISVDFRLVGEYLVVSHTGRHFTGDDIERICGYAEQVHTEKAENIDKTGYKGIGFKAIFSISDSVAIFSNGFQLRFDKNHEQWQSGVTQNRPYPWQIIPLWTEQALLPNELQALLNPQQVQFIVRLQSPALVKKIRSDFQHVVQHPEIALFLRNTKSISFVSNDFNYQINRQTENDFTTLSVNGKQLRQWWLKLYAIDIPQAIHEQLEKMSDYQCPPKLKRAQQVRVSIAYRVSDNAIERQKAQAIYTYLPTQTDLGLPFIINGDFILNPERTGLVVNEWNKFLVSKIPLVNLASLKALTKTACRSTILAGLAEAQLPYNVGMQPFQASYETAFVKALGKVGFLPAATGDSYLMANQCYVDSLGLWQEFPNMKITDIDSHCILSHDLQETARLNKLPTFNSQQQVITWSKLIANLKVYAEQLKEPLDNIRLITFIAQSLAKHTHQYEQSDALEKLRNAYFVLSQQGELQRPKQLYFQPIAGSTNAPLGFTLQYVHATIASNRFCRNFLGDLGVSQCSSLELVERYVIDELLTQTDPEKLILLLQFVFDVNRQKGLEPRHYEALRNIKLVTSKQTVSHARAAFLGDDYRSDHTRLDTYLAANDVLVSSGYLRVNDNADEWLQFFKLIGINTLDTIILRRDYTYEQGMQEYSDEFPSYYRSFGVRRSSSAQSRDYLRVFVTIPLLRLKLSNNTVSHLFWHLLVSNADLLIANGTTNYCYANANNTYEVDSFLVYKLKNTAVLPDQAGRLHMATQLYSPEFLPFARFGLSVARVPISLPEKIIEFVGFKCKLTLTDANLILQGLTASDGLEFIIQAHKTVFNSFLSLSDPTISVKNSRLLAMDNTLQPITKLQYRASCGQVANPSSWLKHYDGFDASQMARLCNLLNIKIVNKVEVNLKPVNPREEPAPVNTVLKALPFLALLQAKSSGQQVKEILLILYKALTQLKSFEVSDLSIVDGTIEKSIPYYLHNSILYFKGRWNRAVLKNDLINEIGRYLKIGSESFAALSTIVDISGHSASNADQIEWLEVNSLAKEMFAQLQAQLSELSRLDISILTAEAPSQQNEQQQDDLGLTDAFGNLSIDEPTQAHIPPGSPANRVVASTTQSPASTSSIATPKTKSPFTTINVTPLPSHIEVKSFTPAHSPETPIDLKKIVARRHQPEARKITMGADSPVFSLSRERLQAQTTTSHETSTLSDTAKQEIGRWGEVRIYYYLKAHYQQKPRYQLWQFQETNSGFTLTCPDQKSHLTIIWPNKDRESGLPYDFKVLRTGVNGKTDERIIDVKTTTATQASDLFVSGNEWSVMLSYKNRYRWFRVRSAGSDESLEILKIKDPAGQVVNGTLQPQQAVFRC